MNRAERRAHEKAERRILTSPHWRKKLVTRLADDKRAHYAATLGDEQVVDLLTPAYSALDAIPKGQGVQEHIGCLWIVARMTHELASVGYGGEDAIREARDAALALAEIQDRLGRLGRVGARGPELLALREMLATHDAQLELRPTRREMVDCMERVRVLMGSMPS